MKKEQFKNLVKKKIKMLATEYLIGLRSKHSKSENLMHKNCMKDYLKSDRLSVEEKKLLFSMKTRSTNVKTNFRNSYTNLLCRLCQKPDEDECEIHLLKCDQIVKEKNIENIDKISYLDIFGTLEKQITAVKVWKKILKVWKIKLEASRESPSGHQVHQALGQSASYADNADSTQTVGVDTPSSDGTSIIYVYDLG